MLILDYYIYMRIMKQNLESKSLKDSLVVNLLLDTHTSCTDHSKTAIVKLFGLHVGKVLGILGLETKRIKSNITCDGDQVRDVRHVHMS